MTRSRNWGGHGLGRCLNSFINLHVLPFFRNKIYVPSMSIYRLLMNGTQHIVLYFAGRSEKKDPVPHSNMLDPLIGYTAAPEA